MNKGGQLQKLFEELFQTLKQASHVKERSATIKITIRFEVVPIGGAGPTPLAKVEFASSEYWPYLPGRMIFDAMSGASKMVDEEGLLIELTSNSDGLREPDREGYKARDIAHPTTEQEAEEERRPHAE
jgi:hypothetical protein